MRKNGFTLVELLVVTAVIGVLGIVSASIMSSILRTQNKTAIINEVRQNGDLVISKFERDVKQSQSVAGGGANVTLTTYTGVSIVWECDRDPPGTGSFTRATQSVINTDADNGVKTTACNFVVAPSTWASGTTQIVTLTFTLEQRSAILKAEYQISERFQVTAGTRAY